jgi:hypothetical protein
MLDRFNLFTALGIARRELRHSDFLAFLLDSTQNHRLGNTFVRRLLEHATEVNAALPRESIPSIPDDVRPSVRREWRNIDLLLVDDRLRLAVIIENKIDSHEHSDQLARYFRQVTQSYPGWQIMAIYLTPDGDQPSHPDYIPISYHDIAMLIDAGVETAGDSLASDLRVVLTHYVQMVRSQIVGDPQIAELCRRIYRQHGRALDLIFAYRDAVRQQALRDATRELIRETPTLLEGWSYKKEENYYADFAVRDWPTALKKAKKRDSKYEDTLLFSVRSRPNGVDLRLFVAPGSDNLRQEILFLAGSGRSPFRIEGDIVDAWPQIYARPLLTENWYDNATDAESSAELRKNWTSFLQDDLPLIHDAVLSQFSP